jgi:aminoglycoside phosphotransferase (APT) family kinase protein
MSEPEDKKFKELVQRIDPRYQLLRTWSLKGGVSAQVTRLEILCPDGETKKWIVRQHGERDRQSNPHIATDEFKLLKILQSAGVVAPTPVHLDESGVIFSTPMIVIEHIEGETEFAPSNLADFLLQFARQLTQIHRVDGSNVDLSFLPEKRKGFGERPATLDEALGERRIRDALESIWPISQLNESVLLHGDFWPGNLLWKHGQLIAVIDWEDAAFGDPLADVANSRLEILWAFGVDAMENFTHHYKSMTPIDFNNLLYWDLCTALRTTSKLAGWGLDVKTEKTMRERHEWFINQAFKKLSDIQ